MGDDISSLMSAPTMGVMGRRRRISSSWRPKVCITDCTAEASCARPGELHHRATADAGTGLTTVGRRSNRGMPAADHTIASAHVHGLRYRPFGKNHLGDRSRCSCVRGSMSLRVLVCAWTLWRTPAIATTIDI